MLNMEKDFKTQMTEARRRQIIMGAAQIFSEKGYHKATTRQIAKAAGISEGTIYNYFENKRDLLLGMIEVMAAQSVREVIQTQAEDNPKTLITALLMDRFELLSNHGRFMAPIFAEVFADEALREAVYQKVISPTINFLEQYLQRQVDVGAFRPVNPMIVARSLVGAVTINTILKVTQLDPRYAEVSPSEMIEEIVSLFLKGVVVESNN